MLALCWTSVARPAWPNSRTALGQRLVLAGLGHKACLHTCQSSVYIGPRPFNSKLKIMNPVSILWVNIKPALDQRHVFWVIHGD